MVEVAQSIVSFWWVIPLVCCIAVCGCQFYLYFKARAGPEEMDWLENIEEAGREARRHNRRAGPRVRNMVSVEVDRSPAEVQPYLPPYESPAANGDPPAFSTLPRYTPNPVGADAGAGAPVGRAAAAASTDSSAPAPQAYPAPRS
ncbi:uncharacterized protein BJ171DRAFT_502740 [Polychytrium aggregatum]|uniref:uncharacterized protein n=1 Tax=Polychytrium aggregatum TaxID=110093 RepID=UPI0022FE8A39|nr:uncharacterized protein BJ171DRAFT_502740 [Polychytrium aggregatum]KAI9205031.1 hypothetical protein BJ171DRAFT_502740 [Polychytrium aggregatum]